MSSSGFSPGLECRFQARGQPLGQQTGRTRRTGGEYGHRPPKKMDLPAISTRLLQPFRPIHLRGPLKSVRS